jgi:hypothetical protein
MSVVKYFASKTDINRIISKKISMPVTDSILKKEKVEVYAIIDENDDLNKIIEDLEEPLNVRFMMDPVESKKPFYTTLEKANHIRSAERKVILGDFPTLESECSLKYLPTQESEKILMGKFEKSIKKNDVIHDNWLSFVTHIDKDQETKFLLPNSNAIIINDSYLFNKTDVKDSLGLINLKNILKNILPKNSKEEFHITIITSDCKWIPSSAREKINELDEFLKNEFNYSFFIELIIWGQSKSDNHKRILISNFYSIVTDYGFDIFNSSNRVVGTNDIVIKRIFHDVDQPGESAYGQSNFRLEILRKTYNDAKNYCRKITSSVGKIYLNNLDDFEKENRLFRI